MSWFGHEAGRLAKRLGLPRVIAETAVTSTMDVAHACAREGAPAGTLVLAEEQRAGRGRAGNRWSSAPRAGIWATLVERPREPSGLDVLSLRVGMRLAAVLDRWTASPVRLKWPNDLFVGERKLAGVLIEVRWREQRPDWVGIGVGINLRVPPDYPEAAGLQPAAGANALDPVLVLEEIVPALRAAAFATDGLSAVELAAFAARDLARDRPVVAPARGIARGIAADGSLLIESEGSVTPWRAGSLLLSP